MKPVPDPLHLLPFDHRHSYVHELVGFDAPSTSDQADTVRDSKRVIDEDFVRAAGDEAERIVATARRDGPASVTCIVLGRGADADAVTHWLETAADVPGFVGFAVGRTTFRDALVDYRARKATRDEATTRIAARFERWITTFERGRSRRRQRASATGSHA